jgi:hypothetical protein
MKRIYNITLGILLSLIVARDASAQWNVARFERQRNTVYTTFGMDPALVTTLGYGRIVEVLGHDFQLSGDVGIATAKVDTRDIRAQLGVQTSLVHWRALQLTGSATGITRGTDNAIYRGINFGADVTAAFGVYRNRWFAAGEFGKDKAVITHVKHTDWYRTNFYTDAKDGWYLDAGGTFHYGATAGVAIGRAELNGRFGWQKTEDFNDLMPPMYASVGIGIGF